jgi:hypothetical protein
MPGQTFDPRNMSPEEVAAAVAAGNRPVIPGKPAPAPGGGPTAQPPPLIAIGIPTPPIIEETPLRPDQRTFKPDPAWTPVEWLSAGDPEHPERVKRSQNLNSK